MLDHGLIGSHASKSLVFLQIQTKSGQVSYHEDIRGLSPTAIKKLYQSPDLINSGITPSRSGPGQKALGTQTVSQPPKAITRHPHAPNILLSPDDVPSRSSSILQGSAKRLPAHKRKLLNASLQQRRCKHFSSIDELLAAASKTMNEPTKHDVLACLSPDRPRTQHNTLPKRARPCLSRAADYTHTIQSRDNTATGVRSIPLRASSSDPSLTKPRHSASISHNHTFPIATLAITHHPSSQSPSSSASPAKRPSLHEPHTLSWTSDATRRLEYAKIDRAYSGLRGFCRKVLPGVCFRDGRRNFWDRSDSDDVSDTDSVRRYRIRLPDSPTVNGEKGHDVRAGEKSSLVPLSRSRARGMSCF